MSRGHQPSIGEARHSRKTHEALPPYRIDRPPKTAAEHDALRKHCRQVVATLQGRLLSRKEINLRAEAMANEAIKEAGNRVREVVKGMPGVIIRPPAPPGADEKRTPGGLIIP